MVHTLNKKAALEIHKKIFLIRGTEEKIAKEYSNQKMRCPIHLSIGQEAVSAVLSCFLSNQDLTISTHRGHAHYIAKNGSLKKMIALKKVKKMIAFKKVKKMIALKKVMKKMIAF